MKLIHNVPYSYKVKTNLILYKKIQGDVVKYISHFQFASPRFGVKNNAHYQMSIIFQVYSILFHIACGICFYDR